MKRVFAVLLCLILLLGCAPAMAASYLPSEVRADLRSRFGGCTVGSFDYGDNFLFVSIIDQKDINVLVIYRMDSSGNWYYWNRTHKAVPQSSKGSLRVDVDYGYWDHSTGSKKYSYTTLHLYVKDEWNNVYEEAWYSHVGGSVWKLMRYFRYSHSYGVTVGDEQLSYFSGLHMSNKIGTAYGKVERDLRYVSLSSIPSSLSKAQAKLTTAPDLPQSYELQAQEIEFKSGKKYPVYSAPSKLSLRGGNGKAAVSTNGWIQVFGTEAGYVMIQYSIDANHYRIGYIDDVSLPAGVAVKPLDFLYTSVTMAEDAIVTDDPFYSGSPLTTVEADEEVTLLGHIGDWAYIEGIGYRGFVPADSIEGGVGAVSTDEVSEESTEEYDEADGLNESVG